MTWLRRRQWRMTGIRLALSPRAAGEASKHCRFVQHGILSNLKIRLNIVLCIPWFVVLREGPFSEASSTQEIPAAVERWIDLEPILACPRMVAMQASGDDVPFPSLHFITR